MTESQWQYLGRPSFASAVRHLAHQTIRQPGRDLREDTENHDRQHHADHIRQRTPHYLGERYVGGNRIDDIDVETDRRMDQPDFHVNGQNHSEPHRIEAGSRDDRQQDRARHQDDRGGRNEKPAHQKEDVDEEHQHPLVRVQVGDTLRQRLREIERREHVTEQHGGGDDGQDHYRFPHRVAQDVPDLLRSPKPVDQDRHDHAEGGADARRLRGSRHASVKRIHHAADDQQEWHYLRDRDKLLLPGIAKTLWVGTEAFSPDGKDRPDDEHAGQHQARHDAGDEQATDRSFSRDAVEDERDRRWDENSQ